MSRSLANTDASWRGVFSPSGGSLGQTNFQAASGAWPGIISTALDGGKLPDIGEDSNQSSARRPRIRRGPSVAKLGSAN